MQERKYTTDVNARTLQLAFTQLGGAAISGGRRKLNECEGQTADQGRNKKQRRESVADELELLFLKADHSVTKEEVLHCMSITVPDIQVNATKLELALLRPAANNAVRISALLDLLP